MTTPNDAPAAYRQQLELVAHELDTLRNYVSNELDQLNETTDGINWPNVGDVNYLRAQLVQLSNHFLTPDDRETFAPESDEN